MHTELLPDYAQLPRPDGKQDDLGIKVLDEPAAQQTDPPGKMTMKDIAD